MSKAESFVTQWMRHRTVLLEVLDRLGEKDPQFKPWDGAMSLSELAAHIAGAGMMFVNSVQTGRLAPPASAPKTPQTMEETRRLVRDLTEQTRTAMAALTDEQLEATVDASMLGFQAPGKVLLHSMREHEIHHKGQLFVYARMVGVKELPFFVAK